MKLRYHVYHRPNKSVAMKSIAAFEDRLESLKYVEGRSEKDSGDCVNYYEYSILDSATDTVICNLKK